MRTEPSRSSLLAAAAPARGPGRWLQRLTPRRLDRQVILLASLMLGVTMPFFALHKAGEDAERVVESLTRQAKALARNIAVTSVEGLVTQDFSSTEQLLLRSARFPGVLEIQVSDMAGRVMGDVLAGPDGEPRLRYDTQPLEMPHDLTVRIAAEDARLRIWEPIVSADAIGWVRMTYSLAEADLIAQRRLYEYLLDGAIMTALLVALILVVMRRPLRMLRGAATFAGQLQNKGGEQIPVDRRSVEIEQLGVALNDASAQLFEQETAIKEALKQLNTQKSAMDEHSIVSISDVEGRITYANQKFLDVTGFSEAELTGRNHRIVNSGHHPEAFFRAMWLTIASGHVWHGEIQNRGKHGQLIWMNTTIVPFMDERGRPYEYVAIRTDVTAQKQVERELEDKARSLGDMTDHLEDLVMQRTSELQDANNKLQHLNNVKSEFVSVVSHELRTPLTSIKSFAEILADDIEELDVDSQRHYLSIIDEETDRLGRLINDLLDLQKIDSGKMSWKDERVDLPRLLESSVECFVKAYAERGLALTLELPGGEFPLLLDADRMTQLVANLLSNALKFTDQGGVRVVLRGTVRTLRALVVGGDTEAVHGVSEMLADRGVVVSRCDDGGAALAALQARDAGFDLAVVDLGAMASGAMTVAQGVRALAADLPLAMIGDPADEMARARLLTDPATVWLDQAGSVDDLRPLVQRASARAFDRCAADRMVEVSVIDSGVGIPEAEISRVFEHFHQVDSSDTREKGGSGLGLAICREIVEHYGGRIWVESALGAGSRFVFTLPLAEEGRERRAGADPHADPLAIENNEKRQL